MKKNYLLIKYEKLLENPLDEFVKITEFIEKISKLKFEREKIERAVRNCSFENLKEQEEKHGFAEAMDNQKFFFLGPKNNWKNILDNDIAREIEKEFEAEMREIQYL